MPSKIIYNSGRDGRKLNTAVKLVRSKKLTSNKTEKKREPVGLPDDLPTGGCQIVSTKTQGGGGATTALSLCVCFWEGCVFVCVSTRIGYVFRCVTVRVTYWLSIWSRWSSLPKVPWKPLRTERVTFMCCCTLTVTINFRHPINLKRTVALYKYCLTLLNLL